MNAKHTPGPWATHSYHGGNGKRFFVETADHQHGIAAIAPNETASSMLTMEQHEANATLIAAAPDLLAACKAVEELFGNPFSDPSAFETCEQRKRLQAAIAKAEGR